MIWICPPLSIMRNGSTNKLKPSKILFSCIMHDSNIVCLFAFSFHWFRFQCHIAVSHIRAIHGAGRSTVAMEEHWHVSQDSLYDSAIVYLWLSAVSVIVFQLLTVAAAAIRGPRLKLFLRNFATEIKTELCQTTSQRKTHNEQNLST